MQRLAGSVTAGIGFRVLRLGSVDRRRRHIDQLGVYVAEESNGIVIHLKNSSDLPFHSVAIWIRHKRAARLVDRCWKGAAPTLSLAPGADVPLTPAWTDRAKFTEAQLELTAIARDNAGCWWRDYGFGWKLLEGRTDVDMREYWLSAVNGDDREELPTSRSRRMGQTQLP